MENNNKNFFACPFSFAIPPDKANDSRIYECMKDRCALWEEDAQACSILVLARNSKGRVPRNAR